MTHNKDSSESLDGYTIAGRSACFLPDQLINMANGTKQKIDDVILVDDIQVFNLNEKELLRKYESILVFHKTELNSDL